MDSEIRKAALRAAAKTAIVVSLSGCALSHGRPAEDDAAVIAAADAGPVSCDSHIRSLAITDLDPDAGNWHWQARFSSDGDRNDPFTGMCCMQLDASVDPGSAQAGSPLAMACCDVIVVAQHLTGVSSLGCTPWGPPVPPEMIG